MLVEALLFAALVTVGLSAGLFVGWSVSVLPGTSRISDATYIETMQHINVAILNRPFFIIFLGPVPLLAAAFGALLRSQGGGARASLAAAAAAVYAVGVVGVTVGGNVPLNDALRAFPLDASADAGALRVRRDSYERPWNRWHYARSAASAAAFALTSLAALAS